jgi:OmpA family
LPYNPLILRISISSLYTHNWFCRLLTATFHFVQPVPGANEECHTDDTGKDAYNMALSEKRANTVANFLISKGVAANRIERKWYGETQPKSPNDSEANGQLNRRIEIGIVANDTMKKQANEGNLQ